MTPETRPPIVVIYQNPAYVAGILQEMFHEGLIESRESEQTGRSTDGDATNSAGKGNLGAKISVPIFGKGTAGLSGDRSTTRTSEQEIENASRTRYSFSDTYYLRIVRDALEQSSQIRTITRQSDLREVATGQFVEFTASFKANEINTILDIATPDLVAATVAYLHQRKGQQIINALNEVDKITVEWQKHKFEAESRATFARAVTHAVRTDFRSDDTREFYGTIAREAEPLTAITICDSAHFVAADHDRILDGEFVVLGKVISDLEQNIAVLDRNKVLSRIDSSFLEDAFAKLDINAKAKETVKGSESVNPIDTEFSATVPGTSFRVLPIAVYS